MRSYPEERLGELLSLLRPAPHGWALAAQELPAARARIADLLVRADADADFRASVLADLEAALAHEGIEPEPHLVRVLRRDLGGLEPS